MEESCMVGKKTVFGPMLLTRHRRKNRACRRARFPGALILTHSRNHSLASPSDPNTFVSKELLVNSVTVSNICEKLYSR